MRKTSEKIMGKGEKTDINSFSSFPYKVTGPFKDECHDLCYI